MLGTVFQVLDLLLPTLFQKPHKMAVTENNLISSQPLGKHYASNISSSAAKCHAFNICLLFCDVPHSFIISCFSHRKWESLKYSSVCHHRSLIFFNSRDMLMAVKLGLPH